MYQKTTLENGLRVVTKSMPNARSIAMGILVDTGVKDEPSDKSGLAHMAEHLLFRGTSNRDSIQIARLMDEAGGQMGGFITRDYTCYTATVLDDYRTFAIELFGDILLNSLFSENDIEREKGTIIREISSVTDVPDQRTDNLLKSYIWNGHYLGISLHGDPEDVKKLTREDVIYFVHSQYLPDRFIISAAGNVEHHDFVSQVRDSFWRVIGESTPRQNTFPTFHSGVIVEHMPVSHVYFSIGFRAFAYSHPQRYEVHILNKIIGGGISSRLFRRIREERGLVYDIRSEYQAYQDDGLIVIEGSTAPEHFMNVFILTISEIWKTFTFEAPIADEELWKAKMQIRGQHLISAENSNTQMSRLATQELYFGNHIASEQILEAIDKIDLNTLANLSNNYLLDSLKNAAVAVVGPYSPDHYNAAMIENVWAQLG
ncbi:MAG: insulinase family protein [Desulfobacteraceae bacterium]|nr:insulinase family protein [Desulfobacteraceae bacterium]